MGIRQRWRDHWAGSRVKSDTKDTPGHLNSVPEYPNLRQSQSTLRLNPDPGPRVKVRHKQSMPSLSISSPVLMSHYNQRQIPETNQPHLSRGIQGQGQQRASPVKKAESQSQENQKYQKKAAYTQEPESVATVTVKSSGKQYRPLIDFNKSIDPAEFSHWGEILVQQRSEARNREALAELGED